MKNTNKPATMRIKAEEHHSCTEMRDIVVILTITGDKMTEPTGPDGLAEPYRIRIQAQLHHKLKVS